MTHQIVIVEEPVKLYDLKLSNTFGCACRWSAGFMRILALRGMAPYRPALAVLAAGRSCNGGWNLLRIPGTRSLKLENRYQTGRERFAQDARASAALGQASGWRVNQR